MVSLRLGCSEIGSSLSLRAAARKSLCTMDIAINAIRLVLSIIVSCTLFKVLTLSNQDLDVNCEIILWLDMQFLDASSTSRDVESSNKSNMDDVNTSVCKFSLF